MSGNALVRNATAAKRNKTENPAPVHRPSAQSITGPNKPAAAAEPAVLKFASPK